MRMGFSRMTVVTKKEGQPEEKESGRDNKRAVVSKEEDDSAANLPVGDQVCCVGVRGGVILCFTHI